MFAVSERMVAWLPNVRFQLAFFSQEQLIHTFLCPHFPLTTQLPVTWHLHLLPLLHPLCPAPLARTYGRRAFDRALRSLAPSLHGRIWALYLRWAELRGGEAGRRVWRRFLRVDPSLTPVYLKTSLPLPLESSKLLLALARRAQRGEYTPGEGESPYQLFVDWLEGVEGNAEEIGMDWEETEEKRKGEQDAVRKEEEREKGEKDKAESVVPASVGGKLIRFDGPMKATAAAAAAATKGPAAAAAASSSSRSAYDEDENPSSLRKLDVEAIVLKDGLGIYKDQAGRLWTGLATYWIKRGEFERVSLDPLRANKPVAQASVDADAPCSHYTLPTLPALPGQTLLRIGSRFRPHHPRLHPDLRRLC
jgi:pre-mRNA-splicing factor SYF1